MRTKTQATIEDLYQVHGKAELVNGEIVHMSPTGGIPSHVAMKITFYLYQYALQTRSGHALPDNAGFVVDLPNRKLFSPDASYYTGELSMKFMEGAPIFAAEVRSEGDYGPAAEEAMAAKRRDYFAAGTQVVWDVDPTGEDVVSVYRRDQPDTPTVYTRGEVAEAEPAMPGWSMPVDELFK